MQLVRERRTRLARGSLLAGLMLALALPLSAAAATQNLNPGVLPPDGQAFGKTYGEWSAVWWQYVFSIPLGSSPFTDDSGANCGLGQSGPVFFLVGTFTTTVDPNGVVLASATRRGCTVPAGKALFFPIFNNECSTLEPPPFHATTPQEFIDCNRTFIDPVRDLRAEVDGVVIQDLTSYRARSPIFDFFLPTANNPDGSPTNILGIPGGGPGKSMADGYYLLLAPFSPGAHIIHFRGFSPPANFAVDVTYAPLTVR